MGRLKTTEEVVQELKLVHLQMFNYDRVEYRGDKHKIEVLCNTCGETFYPRVTHHKRGSGCPHCHKNKLLTKEDFILKAKEVHKGRYRYNHTGFLNLRSKVTITCPIHGDFEQYASNHLKGHGCKHCGVGGGVQGFINKSSSGGVDNDCTCYVIRCFDDNEEFYKIGITTKTVKFGFKSRKDLPYCYEVLREYIGTAIDIYNLEKNLHALNSEHRYTPLKSFCGVTECFKEVDLHREFTYLNEVTE